MTEKTWPRLAKSVTTFTEKARFHGHPARIGPRWDCGGMNQYRSIEQLALSKVQRITLSGPCTTSRRGENPAGLVPTKPPECRAITVLGVGLGDGDGASRRCQVPSGLVAFLASMNVHSMHSPCGDGDGAADRDLPRYGTTS